ncbi:MAG: lipid-A-disaccharide synthase [Candidatus Delongbacteria bacterium]|nr:lipid-A-disaccharide synthase [Candidatus Delongbacteria bacterium]
MQKILIIAGEASGDLQGSLLLQHLKTHSVDLQFSGIGGPLMHQQGVDLLYSIDQMSFLGLWEVIRHLGTIRSIFNRIIDHVKTHQIRTAILIDYPGFNLRLAHTLKKMNCRVIYYISPQLWAWGSNRAKKIKRRVDLLIVILPFEKEFYQRYGITAHFVGHPLIEKRQITADVEAFRLKYRIPADHRLINLQPGSRMQEVSQLMPVFTQLIRRMMGFAPPCFFLIPRASTIPSTVLDGYLSDPSLPVRIIETDDYYSSLAVTNLVITASGTAGLESAIFEKPMAIVYKVNSITYWIAKRLIRIPYLGIANIIAGKSVVPEYIQHELTVERLESFCHRMLTSPADYQAMKEELHRIRLQLGEPGAASRAADLIASFLEGSCH